MPTLVINKLISIVLKSKEQIVTKEQTVWYKTKCKINSKTNSGFFPT